MHICAVPEEYRNALPSCIATLHTVVESQKDWSTPVFIVVIDQDLVDCLLSLFIFRFKKQLQHLPESSCDDTENCCGLLPAAVTQKVLSCIRSMIQ